jgi:ABC-type multidrug transport system fused ATPase/permease subunit
VGINASQNLHDKILRCLLSAPITEFFDLTPIGQIMNRFSADLDRVDVSLPDIVSQFLQNLFQIGGAVFVACIGSPYVLISMAPVLLIFFLIQKYFRKSSREVKRLDAISRSPLLSLFSETINGLSTIRAFKQVEMFLKLNDLALERHVTAFLSTVKSIFVFSNF